MKIRQTYLEKNPYYVKNRKIVVKGLMLHSVGCPQPSAPSFVKSWNDPGYTRACVHAFIDGNTGDVYQTLPWDHRGPHCGGKANDTHIGVEMCEPGNIEYIQGSTFICSDEETARVVVRRTYAAAVELFAYLCKQFGLNPTEPGVILSHSEGHRRGVASGHADPEHLWTQLRTGYTMDGFRNDVKAAMGTVTKVESKKETAPASTPRQVKISIPDLNIRKGPGATYAKTGKYTGKGVFTIIEEKNGWGKLKSGAGWICLSYTERI